MVTVGYLVPGTGLDEAELSRREATANELVGDGVDVAVVAAAEGPPAIETTVEEEWAAVGIHRLVDAHEADTDAFVIGCFGDPGLHGARELTDRPVVGPAQASFHTAAQLADRFACLTILESTAPLTRRLAAAYGLEDRLTGVPVVEAPVLDIDHGSEALVDDMIAAGRRAVADGAEALVPGCMSLSFMRVHDEVSDALGVPFVDPVSVSLATAATYARHGLTQSRAAYPRADRGRLDGLAGAPARGDD
jgi:allantoin racemase